MEPINLSRQIEDKYERYLKTTFYFRDPVLRASFEQALDSGHLSKGPYLEATPVFKQAQTPRVLFPEVLGFPCDEDFVQALNGDRPLYQHQEQAIRRVAQGNNVIVATGTGSGKTEAFLYPILLHLYREFQTGLLCPGVRALILYPMNALANDQRERLAEICKRLEERKSRFRFTFGQYIGETPEDERDTSRHAQDHIAHRLPGELVTRAEIRNNPPHILLTNYSMLEYLLLRPRDSALFDNGQAHWWTYLVLDEAHQYRGSRGIEMGMLLRRFKQRLREGGRSDPFRCIATSATLAGGESDKAAVAHFAADLFGEEFQAQDVILGESQSLTKPGAQSLAPEDYTTLSRILNGTHGQGESELLRLARKVGLPRLDDRSYPLKVGQILSFDCRAGEFRQLVRANPMPVQEIAARVFSELHTADGLAALSQLVELLMTAHDPASDAPLLSARYHLFLRSLEGAFIQFRPEKKILLDRTVASGDNAVFEVALCRECGQHYLVAQKDFKGGRIAEPVRDPGHERFGATFLLPLEDHESSAEDDEESAGDNAQDIFELCLQCGEMARTQTRCGHGHSIRVVRATSHEEDRADQIQRCIACGYNAAGRDPVREIIYGADGPHAVIATTLYQELERKKVLAFADGRQEAAFFAWYLDHSYKDLLSRSTVLHIAQSFTKFPTEGISLSTVADRALQKYREAFKERQTDDELTIRKNIWRAIYREFLTEEQRLSLEGVGLVGWSVVLPDGFTVPNILYEPPWSLNEAEARDLIFLLLDSMRYARAVELETDEDIPLTWKELEFQGSQIVFQIGRPAGRQHARSWDGKQGKRAHLLTKLLPKTLGEEQAIEYAIQALREIWEALRQCDENAPSPRDRFFFSVQSGCRLNPHWWRLHLLNGARPVYRCAVCGQVQTVSVRGICAKHQCSGGLEPISPSELESNHYRSLYQENLPTSLVVEEHTAQLDHAKAREFQRAFRDGKIHVLSCSTTFELGVDLGDLDTTFLRNVPPESFNYAQRVGRVGRRSGHAGFAITYCRRNPHDLYHFANPQQMLSGKVQPPTLGLKNDKILTRHIAATALSEFFRRYPERFAAVSGFCGDMAQPSVIADFQSFLHQSRVKMEQSLRAIIPPETQNQVGLSDGSWIEQVAGESSRIALAVEEVAGDYQNVERLRVEAFHSRDDRTVKWAGDRVRTIEGEEVLSFLSRRAVIPKYGFPVDVVELDTQRTLNQEAYEVSLQRDLAIAVSEFAPTSQLVANKRVWTSYALKRVAEKEWERWWYARCATHARFERKPYRNDPQPPQFEKCCQRMSVALQYIEPRFGFITNRDKPKAPTARPSRVFTTRPYFVGFKEKEGEPIELGVVTLTKVSPGYMVVVCEGRHGEGFFICSQCGAGFRNRREFQKGHTTPYGEKCSALPASLRAVALGHELVTDVLKLQFHPLPPIPGELTWFVYALGYALVEGAAEVLDVPSTDLNTTVAYANPGSLSPIILYDNVPGGAGLVARLEDTVILKECLRAAKQRVSGNCGCGEETSCYGCLRNYRNQFAHQNLQRGPALRYLETILGSMR